MPIAQFTRAYYAMNKVQEDASQALGLGKRAAVVLLILSETDKGRMPTKDLVATFQKWFVSAENTAAKDVSIAKGELFDKDLIMARHGIRNIELTERGSEVATELAGEIERALKNLVERQQDLFVIEGALTAIKPKMPEKALSSLGVTKKPMNSAGDKPGRQTGIGVTLVR
jgi:hypothetical protein